MRLVARSFINIQYSREFKLFYWKRTELDGIRGMQLVGQFSRKCKILRNCDKNRDNRKKAFSFQHNLSATVTDLNLPQQVKVRCNGVLYFITMHIVLRIHTWPIYKSYRRLFRKKCITSRERYPLHFRIKSFYFLLHYFVQCFVQHRYK